MNSPFSITSDSAKELDELIAEFDRDRRNGNARIADYVLPRSHPGYAAYLTELARVDMEYRFEAGEEFSVQRYVGEFADVFSDPQRRAAIAFEEYRLRRRGGEDVSAQEVANQHQVVCVGWPVVGLGESASRVISKKKLSPPDVSYPSVGERFAGYELVERLGEGAYSRVFLARQPDLAERLVALKITPLQTNESDQLARLQHSAIIPVFSVHQEGDLRAICMPFLGSTTLADISHSAQHRSSWNGQAEALVSTIVQRRATTIRSRNDQAVLDDVTAPHTKTLGGEKTLSPKLHDYQKMRYVDAIVSMITDTVRGLAHAHEKGVVHRDLKPANILVSDDGSTIILDFNLAADQTDPSIQIAGGTLPYMSPQQLACLDAKPDIDCRDDVFSVGVVLHEMLTGTLPFSSPSPTQEIDLQRLIEQRRTMPNSPRRLNPRVSPGLESIISRCIAPERETRYASAGELLEDLERHQTNQPLLHARDVALTERCRKWAKRHPRLSSGSSIAAIAAVVLVLCGAAFLSRGWQIERMRAEAILASVQSDFPAVVVELSTPGREPELLKQGMIAAEAMFRDHSISLTDVDRLKETSPIGSLSVDDRVTVYSRISHVATLMHRAAADLAEQSDEDEKSKWAERSQQWEVAADQLSSSLALESTESSRAAGERVLPTDLDSTERQIESLNRELENDPTNVSSWFLLAIANSEAGRPEKAAAGFDVAAKLQPKSLSVLFNRGLFHLSRGNNRDAKQDFDACVAINPKMHVARFNRALASYRQNDLPAALKDLDVLVDSKRAGNKVLMMRSRVLRKMGARDKAMEDIQTALTMKPLDVHDWVSRGSLQMTSSPTAALRDFDQALAIRPGQPEALNNAAYVCSEKLDQPVKALEYLDQLVGRRPIASSFASRGILYARLSEIGEALSDAKSALERHPSAREKLQLAGIYALAGQQLIRIRDEAIDLSPDEARALAFHWLRLAFRQDPALAYTAKSDSDLLWIRDDKRFQRLVDSALSLEQPARSSDSE